MYPYSENHCNFQRFFLDMGVHIFGKGGSQGVHEQGGSQGVLEKGRVHRGVNKKAGSREPCDPHWLRAWAFVCIRA